MKTDVEDNSVKGFPASVLPQTGLFPAVSPGCRCLADSAGCIGRNRCNGWLGGEGNTAVIAYQEGAACLAVILVLAVLRHVALVDAAVVVQQDGWNIQP